MTDAPDGTQLPAATTPGRVAVRVDDLDRLVPFYRDVVGCRVARDGSTARLSAAGGRELLVIHEAPDALPRPRASAGLFHVAIRLPDRSSLADALVRIRSSASSLDGASDHLVSEALYLHDPAGNGLELYRDRPRADWTRTADGRVEMDTLPLDLADLAAAANDGAEGRLPAGTDVGHVHLEVTDLDASTGFYVDGLGFGESSGGYPQARFLAAGGYHHHVGMNTWNRRRDPVGDHQGVEWFELRLPDGTAREAAVARLRDRGVEVTVVDAAVAATDPDGIGVRLVVDDVGRS